MLGFDRWMLKTLKPLASCFGMRGSIVSLGGMDMWYETFGDPKNPAVLLLMGAGCQGVFWKTDFCEHLANLGLFVIRFDYRDTGFSSYCHTPYDLLDMGADAISLLDALHVDSAHLIGVSMGGAIAQLMAVHHRSRVKSITLLATSNDFRPLSAALQGDYKTHFSVSSPERPWLEWLQEVEALPAYSFYRRLKKHLLGWKILHGNTAPFPEKYYYHLLAEGIRRQRSYKVLMHHKMAVIASVQKILETEGKIAVPTLIVHGTVDPLFPIDHAKHMQKSITDSKLMLMEGMGHNFCPSFHETFMHEYQDFLSKAE